MGLSDIVGTIRPSLEADILVVDGDPLADISVLSPYNPHIEMVIARGRIAHHNLFGQHPDTCAIEEM